MPTYPYRCAACEYEWESEHGIHDPVETLCPSCCEETAQRMIGGGQTISVEGGTPRFDTHERNMRQADEMMHGVSKNPNMIHGRGE